MTSDEITGLVIAVRGSVVDARFESNLPRRLDCLRTGSAEDVILEVQSHLDPYTVRAVALNSTRGLARGVRVINTGRGLYVPVGDALLGRMINVFGDAIDDGRALDDAPHRAVHVGDLRRTDVAGARGVGMASVRLRSHHDDTDPLQEADYVADSHADLRDLLGRAEDGALRIQPGAGV